MVYFFCEAGETGWTEGDSMSSIELAVKAEEVTWAAVEALREARRAVELLGDAGWYAAGLAGALHTAASEAAHAHKVATMAVMDARVDA